MIEEIIIFIVSARINEINIFVRTENYAPIIGLINADFIIKNYSGDKINPYQVTALDDGYYHLAFNEHFKNISKIKIKKYGFKCKYVTI